MDPKPLVPAALAWLILADETEPSWMNFSQVTPEEPIQCSAKASNRQCRPVARGMCPKASLPTHIGPAALVLWSEVGMATLGCYSKCPQAGRQQHAYLLTVLEIGKSEVSEWQGGLW